MIDLKKFTIKYYKEELGLSIKKARLYLIVFIFCMLIYFFSPIIFDYFKGLIVKNIENSDPAIFLKKHKAKIINPPKGIKYPTNGGDLIKAYEDNGVYLDDMLKKMLSIINITTFDTNQKFIKLKILDFGFTEQDVTRQEFIEKIKSLGLEECAQDDAPKICLFYDLDQPYFITEMQPIQNVADFPVVWNIGCSSGKPVLNWACYELNEKIQITKQEIVFRINKKYW